jgi:hypothetical protein
MTQMTSEEWVTDKIYMLINYFLKLPQARVR